MKIIQINTTINSGSTGRITEEIGNVLIENGHDSYVAYGRGNASSKSKLIRIGDKIDVYRHVIKTLIFDRHGFGSYNSTKDLLVQIDRIKPDILGLHNIHGYFLNIELLFSYIKEKKIPVIWTLHDAWSFTGHCTFYDSIACEKWKSLCFKCPKSKKYPASLILDQSEINYLDKKRIFNNIKDIHLVAPSHWLGNELKYSFLREYQCSVIHNGIDLEVFKFANQDDINALKIKFGISFSKKILLGVANTWDRRKGLDDFILLRKMLSEDFIIVLIGLSKNQIKLLPQGIIGITKTEDVKELSLWYSAADVFVNPTHQDNFPTTNLEALGSGTPVVTYDTGGSPEALDVSCGEVVRKGDIIGLIKSINKILSKNKIILKEACRKRAELFFNKEHRYHDYLTLYNTMIDKQKK